MYDEIVKDVSLTSDECDLVIALLEDEINNCLSIGAETTITELLVKITTR